MTRRTGVAMAATFAMIVSGCGGGATPASNTDTGRSFTPNYIDTIKSDIARWPARAVTIAFTRGVETTDDATLQAEASQAERHWSQAAGNLSITSATGGAATITLTFAPASDPELAGSIVGVTTRRFVRSSPFGKMVGATIKIEAGLPAGKRQAVIIHEIGHALGLGGHSPASTDIMYFAPEPPGTLSESDTNTIKTLYDSSSRKAPVNSAEIIEETSICRIK